jgi:hypothetical protein
MIAGDNMGKENWKTENWKVKKSYTLSKKNAEFLNTSASRFNISDSAYLNMLLSALRRVSEDTEKILLSEDNLKTITNHIEEVIKEEAKGVKSGG